MNFKNQVTLGIFKIAWTIPRFTPEFLQRGLYSVIATIGWIVRTPGVKRLQFNMSRVSGENYWSIRTVSLTWRALHSYFKYWQQLFAMQEKDEKYVLNQALTENKEVLDVALSRKKGALIVATHSGNWDLAGAWLGITYKNVVTVAEKLEPRELFDLFIKARKRFNLTIYPHTSKESIIETLQNELSQNSIVGLVADRTLSSRGVPVTLFGYACKLPAGPYAIAQLHSLEIIPGAIWFEGVKTRMKLFPPIATFGKSAEEVMQEVADVFQEMISLHPENWHMFQQVWPDHPKKWGGR